MTQLGPKPNSAVLTLVLPFLSFLGLCCGGEPEPISYTTSRDSANVSIVESRPDPERLPKFAEIDPTPLAEVGVIRGNPDQEFGRIRDAILLEGDRVLIADGQAQELSLFSLDGDLLWGFGRKGEGPGEFRNLGKVGALGGDSVGIWDGGNARVTVANVRSEAIRDFPLRLNTNGVPGSVDFLPGGSLLASFPIRARGAASSPTPILHRDSVLLIHLNPSGDRLATLGTFLSGEWMGSIEARGTSIRSMQVTAPFSRSTVWAASRHEFYVGTNQTFEIKVFRRDGSLKRVIRVPTLNLPLTEAEVASQKSILIEQRGGSPGARSKVTDLFQAVDLPETRPAFSELIIDKTGLLWVGEYCPVNEDRVLWYVFGDSGVLLGTVTLPAGSVVHEVGEDYILLQPMHVVDLPFVRLHRLRRNEELPKE